METLDITVEQVMYHNEASQFTVLKGLISSGEVITVTGEFMNPYKGEQVKVSGEWTVHPAYGEQFKTQSYIPLLPASAQAIQRYLASGLFKGIGQSMAAKLVDHFGAATLEVLEKQPERLTEVEGVGKKKAAQITESYAEQSDIREIMLFFATHGISHATAVKIYRYYGPGAVAIINDNPYRMAQDIQGIGFKSSDRIAASLGISSDHVMRIRSGLVYSLSALCQMGNTCVPKEILLSEAAKILEINTEAAGEQLTPLVDERQVHVRQSSKGEDMYYPHYLYRAERQTAHCLAHMLRPTDISVEKSLEKVCEWERHEGVKLAEGQREALVQALRQDVLVLTGGPGTGKTTTVKGIIDLLETSGYAVALSAPTGRAAKRLSEATERKAITLHRLLEYSFSEEGIPRFARGEDSPLEADAVIVDETSMVDIVLMQHLLEALKPGCKLILVGDADQLPSVGPGCVLSDLIQSGCLPVVKLTEVFRQAQESMIVSNAHRINKGEMPLLNVQNKDFFFIETADINEIPHTVVELCRSRIPGFTHVNPLTDIQVVSPMHRTACGVENLNVLLQRAYNPEREGARQIAVAAMVLREGDKVMQIRNDYDKEVFNGDIGIVVRVEDGGWEVYVRYPDEMGGHDVRYERSELDALQLAYAISVHKSQGSEYPVIIMPITMQHRIMLQRNLLYTAVTRAKQLVVLVGSRQALSFMVRNNQTRTRYSLLAERVRECVEMA